MKPKYIHGEVVLAEADEEGGLFEGRSAKGHMLRRYGGYALLEVGSEEAKYLQSGLLSEEERRAILNRHFEPVKPAALPHQDSYGLQRVVGGACINILENIPDSQAGYKVNPNKAVHLLKEYPQPKSNELRPGIPKPPEEN